MSRCDSDSRAEPANGVRGAVHGHFAEKSRDMTGPPTSWNYHSARPAETYISHEPSSKHRWGIYSLVTFNFGQAKNAVGSTTQARGIVTLVRAEHQRYASAAILAQPC